MSHTTNKNNLGRLLAPKRNNYYFGQLLDELKLVKEQDYFKNMDRLVNRLGLGSGVLCGLEINPSKDGDGKQLLCLSPGVAVDQLGRFIIVPEEYRFDPRQVTDCCGKVFENIGTDQAQAVTISICYHECFADYSPMIVSGCNTNDQCAPGTVIEGYCVQVSKDEPSEIKFPEELCEALNAAADDPSERRKNLCEAITRDYSLSKDACVILATVKLQADGSIDEINTCDFRTNVYSNSELLNMILCLAGNTGGTGQGIDSVDAIEGDSVSATLTSGNIHFVIPRGKYGIDGKDGIGLDPTLTKVEWISWEHGGNLPIGQFMEGIRVRWSGKVKLPISPTERTWFIVEVEYPMPKRLPDQTPKHKAPFHDSTIFIQRVLDAVIEINPTDDGVIFRPDEHFNLTFKSTLEQCFELKDKCLCRVILKSNFILDENSRPVDGDFFGESQKSNNGGWDVITGDGIKGGDFESWFVLTES